MFQAIFDAFENSNENECLHKNIEPFLRKMKGIENRKSKISLKDEKDVTIAIVSMCSNVKGFYEGKL